MPSTFADCDVPGYFLPRTAFAAATTWSGSNPKCLCNSLSGAEAPNVFMPMMRPCRADVALPSEGRRLFYRDPRRHLGGKDAVSIFLRLMVEKIPGWHGHHPRANPLSLQLFVGFAPRD